MNIWFLLLAIGLPFVPFSLWAAQIKVMSVSLGYQVRYSHCYNMVVANLLIGAITPGQAGGEPVYPGACIENVLKVKMRVSHIYTTSARIGFLSSARIARSGTTSTGSPNIFSR